MGFDLDEPAKTDLRSARRDLIHGKTEAFVPLEEV